MASTNCYYRNAVALRTSWTNTNPGRRFLTCEKYRENGGCGFFIWFDAPICAHGKQIIPRLLRKGREMENQTTRMQAREKKLWCGLFICCFIIILLLVGDEYTKKPKGTMFKLN